MSRERFFAVFFMMNLDNIHDNFYRRGLSEAAIARDFLQARLPEDLQHEAAGAFFTNNLSRLGKSNISLGFISGYVGKLAQYSNQSRSRVQAGRGFVTKGEVTGLCRQLLEKEYLVQDSAASTPLP